MAAVLTVAALVLLSGFYFGGRSNGQTLASEPVTAFSSSRYMEDVAFLASDALKGRASGSPELDLAADYIAEAFRKAGLKPLGENGTYFQPFTISVGAQRGPRNELEIAGRALRLDEDFVPLALSSTAEFEGPLVFAGYGITAPEHNYDDYAGIDVNGKIVVVFRYEPQENEPSSPFAGTAITPHATLLNKAINARMHGAKGIVFVTPVTHADEEVGPATRRVEAADMGISAVHARRAFIAEALSAAGHDLAELQRKIDAELMPQSFEIPGTVARIATDIVRERRTVKNVIGALEGSDPVLKDEWIVVGAHYDHLGLGERSSLAPSQIGEIHHGADDNASGTAGIMEIARLAAARPDAWKRSVLFIAFAAEEIGLLGSSHFVNDPAAPLDKINAMINLDMIGRLRDDRVFIGGVGTSPEFRSILEDVNLDARANLEETDRSVGLMLNFSETGYGASDHSSFNAKKIPVLFFFSGLHTDYHKPSDTSDKINAEGAGKILSLAYGVIDRVANRPDRLAYVEVQRPPQAARGGGGGYGPYFGSVPDFRDDIKGVLFSAVQNDSPAAKAGLKGGDIMTAFDGKEITTLEDFVYLLRTKRPGDVVPVVVRRNGEDIRVDVTLEARR